MINGINAQAFIVLKLVFFSNVDKERNNVSNCCFNINLEFRNIISLLTD